jgi:asparagine synthase (glutamine-hydrolysing)
MCGIFALLSQDESKNTISDELITYFQKGKKRGPEHSCIEYVSNGVLFGFHRLAINGLDKISNQPLKHEAYTLICNGEIYNYNELIIKLGLSPKTNSDCEVILGIYEMLQYKTLPLLHGDFAFILYDSNNDEVIVARDPYGEKSLYVCYYKDKTIGFCSDMASLMFNKEIENIESFQPGTFAVFKKNDEQMFECLFQERYYYNISKQYITGKKTIEYYMYYLLTYLQRAIILRVCNSERPLASLLSGGLDSSIICAYVTRFYKKNNEKTLETYSIGLEDAEDLKYSQIVADHIGSTHKQIVVSNETFISSIPEVIKDIESYDTTTVRASVGNWNIGKYIKTTSDAKVIFNGDGADELMGGYLYFHCAPNDDAFDYEINRLLGDIHHYDVRRSDRSISSHGLEARTPFLDREFTKFYLSIPIEYRNHNNGGFCEKYLIRKAIELYDTDLLPKEILWRKKEAFSDGVSSLNKSWYEIIQETLETNDTIVKKEYEYNTPKTLEQMYYRQIFEEEYPSCEKVIPYFWMPRFIENAQDASARTLNIYNKTSN